MKLKFGNSISLFGLILISLISIISCTSYEYPDDFGYLDKVLLSGHEDKVIDLDISPSGEYITSASFDDTVRVWDTGKLAGLGVSDYHPDDVYSVSFSRDMSHVATGCRDGAIRIYSLPDGELVHLMRGHAEAVYSIAFSPANDILISGGEDSTVRVWDTETGELLKVFREHSDEVNSVIISSDGELGYSASGDGTIRSWYLTDTFAPGFIEKISRHGMISIELSPDGNKLAFTGKEKILDKAENRWKEEYPLYIADIGRNGLENIETRLGHTKAAWGLAWAPDGRTIVTGGTDDRLFFHDVANSENRQKVLPKVGSIWDLEFSPDGSKLFVASSSPDILVYMK